MLIHLAKGTLKKKIGSIILIAGTFSLSAGCTFFMIPQTIINERDNSPAIIDEDPTPTTGRERFISNLTNAATSGLSINAKELVLEYDGKTEGETKHVNRLDASGTSIDFSLTSLSLHGINFALTAPIAYSDNGENVHYRGVHASMVNETIYLDLFGGKKVIDDNNVESVVYDDSSWDFKYKVSLASYDTGVVDPLTGGLGRYEYGDLDWLIEDILSILSEGGIDISLEGWLNSLTSPASEETESTSSGLDTDALLSSLGNMVEYRPSEEADPYFIWNLPLGDTVIPLGMRGNADYEFTGVDLPAAYVYEEDSVDASSGVVSVATANSESAWEIQEGLRLSAKADISSCDRSWDAASLLPNPEVIGQYRDLTDSMALFRSVAKYVANPQFGLNATLDLGYASDSEEVAGTRTKVGKEASHKEDSIRLVLDGDADLAERKFNGAKGSLSVQKVDKSQNEEAIVARHDINVSYLYDHVNQEGNGYLDINNSLFKAHTTKTYLDEFYSAVLSDAFSSSDTEEQAESSNTLEQIQTVMNKLGMSIDSILDSDVLKGIQNGVYPSALDLVETLSNEDNKINVVLTLAPLGLSGKIRVTLRGVEENNLVKQGDLLSIRFEDIAFASFRLNGEIKTRDFHAISAPQDADSYDTLCHLKGIGEQITDIVDKKAFSANLGLTVKDNTVQDETATKLSLDGSLAFAFTEQLKQGKATFDIHQSLTDKIVSDHRLALDLKSEEASFDTVAFGYASASSKASLDTNMNQDGKKAKMSFAGFGDTVSFITDRFQALDARFDRFSLSLASNATAEGLLSRLVGGEYSALLEKTDIINVADLHHGESGDTYVEINPSAFGLGENDKIAITLAYEANTEEKEGGIESLSVALTFGETDIDLNLGSIASVEVENAQDGAFANFEDASAFKDISFLSEIAEYAVGTLTLGTTAGENGDVSGISYYGLQGDLSVKIGTHDLKIGLFDAYASVEGAETKIYTQIDNLPVIRGVNAPDNAHYFRPNEAEGARSFEVMYYANGVNPEGEALLTRTSDYGRIRAVRDAVRLDGKDFTSNLIDWLGRYSLGINDELLDVEEVEPTNNPTSGFQMMPKKQGGLLSNEALRIETVLNGFSKSTVDGVDTYALSVDLGALVGINVLGDATISLSGRTVFNSDKSASFKTLTGLNVHADASSKSVNGNALKLASVDFDLYLNNISSDGVMENVWENSDETARFDSLFIRGEVDDSGLLSASNEGYLYNPDLGGACEGFTDVLVTELGEETQTYVHDFRGLENVVASNLYLLP